ncbi:MAG: hypothetical protein KVP17_002052 [Porospora cf. gigantea B]|uniref:uncharacterized protein n=1 Tax=Porospora cf. gigantea B TaxID=2853592 RepID=UPI003571BF57|nr:MAG: hypothetical protein KVP17_002052 [Porospora cf. gigantea B]
MPPFAEAWLVGALTGVSAVVGAGFSFIAVLAMVGVCFSVLASAQDGALPVILSVLLLVGTEVGIIVWIAVPVMSGASERSFEQSRWAAELPAVLLREVKVPFADPAFLFRWRRCSCGLGFWLWWSPELLFQLPRWPACFRLCSRMCLFP